MKWHDLGYLGLFGLLGLLGLWHDPCCWLALLSLLSFFHLARPAAHPPASKLLGCSYQDTLRQRGGRDAALCTLPAGRCLFQRHGGPLAGQLVTLCASPHHVAADGQMLDASALPNEDVRHDMTADPVVARSDLPSRDLVRLMADEGVHRVIATDLAGRPTGVVSSMDVVRAVAYAPTACAAESVSIEAVRDV